MSGAVCADDTCAVQRERHVQILQTHSMYQLIEPSLQERRVDRGYRFETLARHARRERHCMLLGDADVKSAIGKLLEYSIYTGAVGHRRGQCDDPLVGR